MLCDCTCWVHTEFLSCLMSTLVQVMACCLTAPSHYPNQCCHQGYCSKHVLHNCSCIMPRVNIGSVIMACCLTAPSHYPNQCCHQGYCSKHLLHNCRCWAYTRCRSCRSWSGPRSHTHLPWLPHEKKLAVDRPRRNVTPSCGHRDVFWGSVHGQSPASYGHPAERRRELQLRGRQRRVTGLLCTRHIWWRPR